MKRFILLTNVISPHQLPLAREIAKLVGDDNLRYVYTQDDDKDHRDLGWRNEIPKWCIKADDVLAREWLENADVLLSGLREFDLFERRAAKGLNNLYMSERWFKPPIGMLRLLHPRYFCYARRLCRLMYEGKLMCFPIGIHAARDMASLCELMHGDLRCLFRAPKLYFESKPGGAIWLQNGGDGKRYCLDKMCMWGYFVEPSQYPRPHPPSPHPPTHNSSTLKVIWVGRLLNWKRVDTIIRAVGELDTNSSNNKFHSSTPTRSSNFHVHLDIYGTGPEENRLKKLAANYGDRIKFYSPVPITDVRKLMRSHDVYVLSSNAYEGWGAVVSEALEEGMKVIGTYEAGSSATLLPEDQLYHVGDVSRLQDMLRHSATGERINAWTLSDAVKALINICVI